MPSARCECRYQRPALGTHFKHHHRMFGPHVSPTQHPVSAPQIATSKLRVSYAAICWAELQWPSIFTSSPGSVNRKHSGRIDASLVTYAIGCLHHEMLEREVEWSHYEKASKQAFTFFLQPPAKKFEPTISNLGTLQHKGRSRTGFSSWCSPAAGLL